MRILRLWFTYVFPLVVCLFAMKLSEAHLSDGVNPLFSVAGFCSSVMALCNVAWWFFNPKYRHQQWTRVGELKKQLPKDSEEKC